MSRVQTKNGQPGVYNTSLPTLSDGDAGALAVDVNGRVLIGGSASTPTIADGADVAEGATTDAAVTAGSTGTVSGKLRQISADISTIKNSTLPAGQTVMASSLPVVLASDELHLTVPFTTTVPVNLTSTDCFGYKTVSVQFTSVGGSSLATFQMSNDNSNWVNLPMAVVGNSGANLSTVGSTASTFQAPLTMRYFRIVISGIASGTTAGVIEFSSIPWAQQLVAQQGAWTVSSNPAAATTGGASFLNIAAGQATTTVKSGAGTLYAIVLNSAATATNTTTVYDNTAASGTVIGRPAVTTATVPTTLTYGVTGLAFATGLTIITATANGGDMTIMYK